MSTKNWRLVTRGVFAITLWAHGARAESDVKPTAEASAQPSASTPPAPQPSFDDSGWDVGWENILGEAKPQKTKPGAKDKPRPEQAPDESDDQNAEASGGRAPKAPNDLGPIPTTLSPIEYLHGARAHDGFYLRVTYGMGLFEMSVQPGKQAGFYLSGVMKPLELRMGGTPLPGLVIGPSYVQGSVNEPEKLSSDHRTLPSPKQANLTAFGVFLDFYPWVDGGLHASTTLHYAATDVKGDQGAADGWAYGVGIGYDVWASSQWSLGLEIQGERGSFTRTRADVDESTHVTTALWSLSATASYH